MLNILPKEIIINILIYLDNFKDIIQTNKYIYNLFLQNKNYIGILKLKSIGFTNFISLDKYQNYNDYYKILYYIKNNKSNYIYSSINLTKFLYCNKKIMLNYHEINDVLNSLIQTNNIQVLDYFLEVFNIYDYSCAFSIYVALLCGNLNVIKKLVEKYRDLFKNPLIPAIIGEQDTTIYYLLNKGFDFDAETIHTAAYKGHLELVKHLFSLGCEYTNDILEESLKNTKNDTTFWIIHNLNVNVTKECINIAVQNSNIPILYLFYNMKVKFCADNLNKSIILGDDTITLFLLNKCGIKISKRTLELSLLYSCEELIFYLLNIPESDTILKEYNILQFAVEKCSANIVKYLISHKNQALTKQMYIHCILKNREDILQILLDDYDTSELNKSLMRIAIVKGNLNIVKLLHKKIKSPVFIYLALRHRQTAIANYLKQ